MAGRARVAQQHADGAGAPVELRVRERFRWRRA
jgi:hypothetical protein